MTDNWFLELALSIVDQQLHIYLSYMYVTFGAYLFHVYVGKKNSTKGRLILESFSVYLKPPPKKGAKSHPLTFSL